MRLHIGSGPIRLDGWTNVDVVPYPTVDSVLDVREPWPFNDVEFIFAEHFIEHLSLADGIRFLRNARRALLPTGVLRVSTPSLDWVWLTHYKDPSTMTPQERLFGCLEINRAFHGWGHKFLYNPLMLEHAFREAGFGRVVNCDYGQSEYPDLQNLERHERQQDLPGYPCVIIAEGSGVAAESDYLLRQAEQFFRDFDAT